MTAFEQHLANVRDLPHLQKLIYELLRELADEEGNTGITDREMVDRVDAARPAVAMAIGQLAEKFLIQFWFQGRIRFIHFNRDEAEVLGSIKASREHLGGDFPADWYRTGGMTFALVAYHLQRHWLQYHRPGRPPSGPREGRLILSYSKAELRRSCPGYRQAKSDLFGRIGDGLPVAFVYDEAHHAFVEICNEVSEDRLAIHLARLFPYPDPPATRDDDVAIPTPDRFVLGPGIHLIEPPE